MTAENPKTTGGVRSIEDIRLRCWIDDVTKCWHWKLAPSGNGAPSLWVPDLRKRTTLGVAICFLTTGKPPKPGEVWHPTCSTPNCANPGHRKRGNRSSQMLAAKLQLTPEQRARYAVAGNERSRIPAESAAAIRADDRTLAEIAAEHGVHLSHISRIRRSEARKPLAAPGASAFNWSPKP